MAKPSPFGYETRMRVLNEYFNQVDELTEKNAWEHVYKCLLWIDELTGLAHIYDSNHMQPGRVFHERAKRFTECLCNDWGIEQHELRGLIDFLFQGCVAEWKEQEAAKGKAASPTGANELIGFLEDFLKAEGLAGDRAEEASRAIEEKAREFFTIGNKRKNALGEGFEDLLTILLQRVAGVPKERFALRTPVSGLPGFRKAPKMPTGAPSSREPRPDVALVQNEVTHVIATAKWSMRQDREQQFQYEYNAFQMNKVQSTELQYVLITNEFDTARLDNVMRAMPGGRGGYVFHHVYHVNLDLLKRTQAGQLGSVNGWIETGKLQSLSAFLSQMRHQFGES